MTTDAYLERVEEFKHKLLNSSLYKEYLNIDRSLYEDDVVVTLAIEKSKLEERLETAYNVKCSSEVIDDIMCEITKVQQKMCSLPLVQKYMQLRMRIKDILKILEDGILIPVKGTL